MCLVIVPGMILLLFVYNKLTVYGYMLYICSTITTCIIDLHLSKLIIAICNILSYIVFIWYRLIAIVVVTFYITSLNKHYTYLETMIYACIFEIVATKYTTRKNALCNNNNEFHTQ